MNLMNVYGYTALQLYIGNMGPQSPLSLSLSRSACHPQESRCCVTLELSTGGSPHTNAPMEASSGTYLWSLLVPSVPGWLTSPQQSNDAQARLDSQGTQTPKTAGLSPRNHCTEFDSETWPHVTATRPSLSD